MKKQPGYLSLSDKALANLGISTQQIIVAIEKAVVAEARGEICTAPKSALLPGGGRYIMTTLSSADDPPITVVKSVMVAPDNPSRGLNAIEGAIILHDSATGELLAVIGSKWITGVRTAGLSAVVAKRLANPKSKTIAFIGCGVQARSHLEAFSELFSIKEIHAYGRGQANIERLCILAQSKGINALACKSPRTAIEDADVVVSSVTLSFELEPFVDARWLKPGAFAAITDAATPWEPDNMDAFETVIIDDLGQEKASENKMIKPELITTDLSGLLAGNGATGYQPDKPSAFVFRGIAIGDFAVASLAYLKARAVGNGDMIHWE